MDKRIESRPSISLSKGFLFKINEIFNPINLLNIFSTSKEQFIDLQKYDRILEKGNLFLDLDFDQLIQSYPYLTSLFKTSGSLNLQHISQLEMSRFKVNGFVFDDVEGRSNIKGIPIKYSINMPVNTLGTLIEQKSYKVHPDKEINEFSSWEFLKNLNVPIHSVIFIDRYAFQYENIINRNFLKIFKSLLFLCNGDDFYFTIITSAGSSMPVDKLQEIIEDYFYEIDSDRNLHLSIYYLPEHDNLTHDRKILTNYFILTSGHSFNYFNKENKVVLDTRITITPVLYRNDLLVELKSVRQQLMKFKPLIYGRNPLLEI